jgi:hypothetical protein
MNEKHVRASLETENGAVPSRFSFAFAGDSLLEDAGAEIGIPSSPANLLGCFMKPDHGVAE